MTPAELNKRDYPPYYQKYLDQLPGGRLVEILSEQMVEMERFLAKLTHADLSHTYAEGKWSVAQVIQHMLDTERIFQYRALCIARKDQTPLPGFDQDAYVPVSRANARTRQDFKEEYTAVRLAGISLFKSFNREMLLERGISSGGNLTVAAAGFITAGHERHHLKLFKSNYKL